MDFLRLIYTLAIYFIYTSFIFCQPNSVCSIDPAYHAKNIIPCSFGLPDKNFILTPDKVIEKFHQGQFVKISETNDADQSWLRNEHWLVFSLVFSGTGNLPLKIKFSDLQGVWKVEDKSVVPIEFSGYIPSYSSFKFVVFPDQHALHIELQQNKIYTFLCKTHPKYTERGPEHPLIYNPYLIERHVQKRTAIETLLQGFVFGIMLMFFMVALVAFTLLSEKAFLAYCVYVFLVSVYLWRDFEYLNFNFFSTMKYVPWHYTKVLTTVILGVAYMLFIRYTLNTKKTYPLVDRIMQFLLLLLTLAIPIDYFGSELLELWNYRVAMYFIGIVILANQLFINVYFIQTNDAIARSVAMGSIFLAIGGMSIPLSPPDIHTWIVRSCFIIEMSFFMFALVIKAKGILADKNKMESQLKDIELRHEYDLKTKLAVEKATTADNLRNELARDIHDEIGALMTKITLSSHLLSGLSSDTNTQSHAKNIEKNASNANTQLRELLFSINPDFDKFSALQTYFRQIANNYLEGIENLDLDFEISTDYPDSIFDRYIKNQLLFILKEALNNVVKHANASQVSIRFMMIDRDHYTFSIHDNGIGFDIGDSKTLSMGLKNMKIRSENIKAKFIILSSKGSGTTIIIEGCTS
ncbi:MAG: hypothetical protein IPK35_15485 [Saprospiraceae bacterium]|jgi:signal transduction histidine kinase|nr:hypothetical protein [Saprospiraceae bacterium]